MTPASRALFLDRDGVINVNHGHVHTRDRFDFIDGIFDACRQARALGYLLIVATNQAGIGRGYYGEAQFRALTDWMCGEFARRGVPLERVYFCPYHPQHGLGPYRRDAPCRKPNPGMILEAARDYHLDLSACVLVGDKPSDIEAGERAGVGCNVLYAPEAGPQPASVPVIRHLRELAAHLRPATRRSGTPRNAA
ncbi:MAG TPA: HAD family hydrolase [Burkholderiales bacterium]|jgi:D-glycero-D-manno-heptose 1,7-bisphosphate phosphatase|nr:HAD family hydrolase [Burkholderiales bacterium]